MSTPPERKLWAILYSLRQQGYQFRRQHPIGPYYADFVCVRAGLVVEADGITHTEASDIAYDNARTAVLEQYGFRVLRFWNNEIMQNPDGVFDVIERALRSLTELTPTPVPSPSGGGPRKRKLRSGLRELAARTGEPVSPRPSSIATAEAPADVPEPTPPLIRPPEKGEGGQGAAGLVSQSGLHPDG